MPNIDETKNVFRVRQKSPTGFDSFATKPMEGANGISMVLGIKNGTSTVQSLLFSKKVYPDKASVKSWISKHPNFKILDEGIIETQLSAVFASKLLDEGNVQIMRTGKWNHPVYGWFEITKSKIQNFIKNFKNNVRGHKDENGNPQLDTDYDHKKRTDKASGWIKGLSVKNEGNELWAKMDFTSDAKKAIKNGEYKYFSPEFTESYTDPETNKTIADVLLGGALTNRPFIKGMSAVSASDEQSAGCDIYLLMDDVEVDQTNTQRKEGVSTMDSIKELAELKGVHNGTVKELDEAKAIIVKNEANIADQAKKLDEANATIKEMKDAEAKRDKDAKDKEVKTLMESAIKAGKVKPADTKEIDGKKGFLLKLAENDIESAKEVITKLPKVLNDEAEGDSGAGMNDDDSKTGKKELSETDFDIKATKLAEKNKVEYEVAVKSLEADGFKIKAV